MTLKFSQPPLAILLALLCFRDQIKATSAQSGVNSPQIFEIEQLSSLDGLLGVEPNKVFDQPSPQQRNSAPSVAIAPRIEAHITTSDDSMAESRKTGKALLAQWGLAGAQFFADTLAVPNAKESASVSPRDRHNVKQRQAEEHQSVGRVALSGMADTAAQPSIIDYPSISQISYLDDGAPSTAPDAIIPPVWTDVTQIGIQRLAESGWLAVAQRAVQTARQRQQHQDESQKRPRLDAPLTHRPKEVPLKQTMTITPDAVDMPSTEPIHLDSSECSTKHGCPKFATCTFYPVFAEADCTGCSVGTTLRGWQHYGDIKSARYYCVPTPSDVV